MKTILHGTGMDGGVWEEKVDQIRIYSGTRYQAVEQATAGTVCAVTGLKHTFPGEGLGFEPSSCHAVLEPVLTYQVILPEGCDPHTTLLKLKPLEEEDPQLHLIWNGRLREIHVQLMVSTAGNFKAVDFRPVPAGGFVWSGQDRLPGNHHPAGGRGGPF